MDWTAITPLFFSGVAVTASALFGYLSLTDRRTAAQLNREKDLHEWVQKVGAIVAEIRSEKGDARTRAVTKLSIEIDYGRLLFPNEETEEAKKWHPAGRRSAILDRLVETCARATKNDWDDRKIAQDWREFVNQLRSRTTAFKINTSPEASGAKKYRNA